MTKDTMPLSMTESLEFIEGEKERDEEVRKFIKKFIKLKPEEAKKIRERVEQLNILKVKPEHTSKIIDILPEDPENLNKIFTDVSLDEDEIQKILNIIKEFK